MPRFVIHEHFATHHHWDLRLEIEGVLESWAVPKKPPIKTGLKRLCIKVSPHALSYISFEGEIPEGQYGAGTVEIWDKGRYDLVEKKRDKIVFKLNGKKLKGEYALIKFSKAGEKNWLLFKTKEKKGET